MRLLSLLLLSLAAAGPAAAQLLPSQTYDPAREAELANQQMLARQQDTALRNQMMTMEAQARADQGVRQLEAQGARPVLSPGAAMAPGTASVPEDRLAASRKRVQDAARNRR